ncbi:hypothetical protein AK812_SmicGene11154 [Symbiodinium microadriaticum]|uniref:Uncharacterized protein n=1 Tax=Symbiodinium microadriaticum TaxID=2951 RepID=A0A1Q9EDZ9_SYMMI|nr:hypothetical protein AK812_SmicGene11154 [Symbiodinium microadriaticum]
MGQLGGKEEAEAKALELQKRLREKRAPMLSFSKAEEERKSEKEKAVAGEQQRKESTRMMVEAQEKAKEEEIVTGKEEHERHRAELKERLRQDYIDRFGCEPPEEKDNGGDAGDDADDDDDGSGDCDQLAFHLNKLKKTYKEAKFKKLKLDNKDALDILGFEKKEDCLEQRKSTPDGFLCGPGPGPKKQEEPIEAAASKSTDGALASILIGVGVTLVFFLGLYCALQMGRRRSQQQEPLMDPQPARPTVRSYRQQRQMQASGATESPSASPSSPTPAPAPQEGEPPATTPPPTATGSAGRGGYGARRNQSQQGAGAAPQGQDEASF